MILDPDYARVFTQARIIAWQYGYACVAHGSYTRDLDLLLTPWEDRAGPNHDQLLKLIADACGLRFRDGVEPVWKAVPDFTEKPHGRRSCSLLFKDARDRRWVDVSITPCVRKHLDGEHEYASWFPMSADGVRVVAQAQPRSHFEGVTLPPVTARPAPPPIPRATGVTMYFTSGAKDFLGTENGDRRFWPIPADIADPETYTPEQRLDLLVKAGALIAAEIDRQKRALGVKATDCTFCAGRGTVTDSAGELAMCGGCMGTGEDAAAPGVKEVPAPDAHDSTGAMAAAWFGTPGAGAAIERVFGKGRDGVTVIDHQTFSRADADGG